MAENPFAQFRSSAPQEQEGDNQFKQFRESESGGRNNPFAQFRAQQPPPSPPADINAMLPETLNVAGFDTGIPLNKTAAKGLVMLGEGMDSVATGTRQRFNELSGDKETARQIAQDTARKRELYEPMREAHPIATTVLGATGQMAATAPLMFLPGGAAASALTRMGNSAVQGGAVGYLTPTAEGESVAKNTVIGAGAGAGISGVLSTLGKGFNAAAGNFANKEIAEKFAASKATGVPLSAGELMNSPTLKRTETLLENVPLVGTGRFRTQQSEATLNAARQAVDSLRPGLADDAGEAIHSSLRRVLSSNKAQARALYDAVETASLQPGVTPIAPNETRIAATQLLKDYPDIFDRLPAGTVKSKLEAVMGATSPKASPVLGLNGAPILKPAEMTFEEARFLRKQLSNYIDRAAKSAGAVGDDELRQLTALKTGLENDISSWGGQSQNAAVKQAFESANGFYRDKVAPFKGAMLNKAAGKDFDTDTIFKTFVKPGRENLAGKLVGNLDAEGHQAVKYGVLKSAFDNAMDEKTGAFSPLKFAGGIEKLGRANNAIFSDVERQQLDGLVKVMAAAQRAGQFMENPPTGNRVAQLLLGAGGVAGPAIGAVSAKSVLAGAGVAGLMTTLTTTGPGKRFLIAASKLPAESPELDSMFARGAAHFFTNANRSQPRSAAAGSVSAYREGQTP